MPMEGRTLGKIVLRKETSDEIIRIRIEDGNEIEENKMVIGARFRESISSFDVFIFCRRAQRMFR